MISYNEWKRNMNRKLRIKAEEDRDSNKGVLFHSIFYHRYFEGYKESYEIGTDGKPHLKRTYAGMWYVQKVSAQQALLLRIGYVLLFVLLFLLLVGAAKIQGASGTALYVVIPEILIVLMLFRIFYILIASYLFSPKKMTIHDYESSSRALITASLLLSAAELLSALMTLLYGAIGRNISGYLPAAGMFLLGALLALAMAMIEKKVPYEEVFNKEGSNAEGLEIE